MAEDSVTKRPAPAAAGEKAPASAQPVVAKPPVPAEKPAAPAPEKPAPVVHVYNRQKDQHVVGPGCWCFPKIEIVDGRKIVVHKRS